MFFLNGLNTLLRNLVLFLIAGVGSTRIKKYHTLPPLALENTPYLIVANHESVWDPVFIHAFLWKMGIRQVSYMAKQELFEIWWLAPIIRWLGAFPVNRATADRTALREALKRIKDGDSLVIFPEATFSDKRPNTIAPFKPGAGYIWKNTGVPLLCLGISGARDQRRVSMRSQLLAYTPDYTEEKLRLIVQGLTPYPLSSP